MSPLIYPRPQTKTTQERRIEMPEFGSPFSGLANDRKPTKEELI
jgi:hypothetical protein